MDRMRHRKTEPESDEEHPVGILSRSKALTPNVLISSGPMKMRRLTQQNRFDARTIRFASVGKVILVDFISRARTTDQRCAQ